MAGMLNAGDPCGVCSRPREVIADLQGNHERVGGGVAQTQGRKSAYQNLGLGQNVTNTHPLHQNKSLGEHATGSRSARRIANQVQTRVPKSLSEATPFEYSAGCETLTFQNWKIIDARCSASVFIHNLR